MKSIFKKIAFVLALAMVVTMMPTKAFLLNCVAILIGEGCGNYCGTNFLRGNITLAVYGCYRSIAGFEFNVVTILVPDLCISLACVSFGYIAAEIKLQG